MASDQIAFIVLRTFPWEAVVGELKLLDFPVVENTGDSMEDPLEEASHFQN